MKLKQYNVLLKTGSLTLFLFLSVIVLSADQIHDAVKKGDIATLRSLLKKNKKSVHAADRNGKTALHFAAQMNRIDMITLLKNYGAKLDAGNVNGVKPLHYAVYFGHKGAVLALLELGADINGSDRSGNTALEFAIGQKRKEIAAILLKKNIRIDLKLKKKEFLHDIVRNDFEQLFLKLLKNGAQPDSLSQSGGTILHSAVVGANPDLIKLILKKNIAKNRTDGYGKTALYYAMKTKNKPIISLLTNAGCRLDTDIQKPVIGNYLGQNPPGMAAELFAPEIISVNNSKERDIAFSKKGDLCFFSRNNRIVMMERKGNQWGKVVVAPFSTGFNEAEAFFTPDDKRVYFISTKPIGEQVKAGPWEIWYTDWKNGSWSNVQLIDRTFKGCFYTSFTRDWKMYYTDAKDDLYVAQYRNGSFEKPVNLGPNINTDKAEYNAFVSPDESWLIFTSFGWGEGFGGGDLWISFRSDAGKWQKPINMGRAINSKYHEYCPYVSPDGKFLFFTSNRLGNEDLYWIDVKVIEELNK